MKSMCTDEFHNFIPITWNTNTKSRLAYEFMCQKCLYICDRPSIENMARNKKEYKESIEQSHIS